MDKDGQNEDGQVMDMDKGGQNRSGWTWTRVSITLSITTLQQIIAVFYKKTVLVAVLEKKKAF